MTWHLIKEQLVEAYGIKVNDEEVRNMARQVASMQFAQYGMTNLPENLLDNYVQRMLEKKETVENLVNRVIENKLGVALIAKVTLEKKTVSVEEFNKLFQS